MQTLRIATMTIALVSMVGALSIGQEPQLPQKDQIGESLGRPIHRNEIRVGKDVSLSSELHRLFTSAATKQYREAHKHEVTPTAAEIATATEFFDNQHRERIREQEAALRAKLKSLEEQLAQTTMTEEESKQLEVIRMSIRSKLKPPGKQFCRLDVKQLEISTTSLSDIWRW